jgi:hypothetical protein
MYLPTHACKVPYLVVPGELSVALQKQAALARSVHKAALCVPGWNGRRAPEHAFVSMRVTNIELTRRRLIGIARICEQGTPHSANKSSPSVSARLEIGGLPPDTTPTSLLWKRILEARVISPITQRRTACDNWPALVLVSQEGAIGNSAGLHVSTPLTPRRLSKPTPEGQRHPQATRGSRDSTAVSRVLSNISTTSGG